MPYVLLSVIFSFAVSPLFVFICLSLQGASQSAADDGIRGLEATKEFQTPANPQPPPPPPTHTHTHTHTLSGFFLILQHTLAEVAMNPQCACFVFVSRNSSADALCSNPAVHAQPLNILPRTEGAVHFGCKWTNYSDRMGLCRADNLVSHLEVRAGTVSVTVITAGQINPYSSACAVLVTGLMNPQPSFKQRGKEETNERVGVGLQWRKAV